MTLLRAEMLSLALPNRAAKPLLGPAPMLPILNGINLELAAGESLALVGESGSGKTTLGRTLLRLYRPTDGHLAFDGRDITDLEEDALRPLRADMQMIFQDPLSSLNPRRRVGATIAQPLLAYGRIEAKDAGRAADALLERVGLPAAFARRFPHELSGGQRQRVGIARAIALKPKLVVADEIVSGLDVSTQAQILDLLRELRRDLGLALIFISHDLSVVRVLCERAMVLRQGRVAEQGATAALFAKPRHPYTRALLDAIPLPEVDPAWSDRPGIEEGVPGMKISGATALVTGASRGMGRAFVEALIAAGAAKVYAAARDPATVADLAGDKVVPLRLDVTEPEQVAAAARQCDDVNLLINNAGVNRMSGLLDADGVAAARAEIETNYFGTLAMCRAFAPVLGAKGGGAIVNMMTILARVNLPLMGSYCASKAAGLSLTQGVRAELAAQGTLVMAVMPGAVNTEMSKDFPPPKAAPAEIVQATLKGLEAGDEEVYAGDMAQGVSQGLAADPKAVEKEFAGYLPG
ncbi:MAG: SDR family oxidoreductase [Alphaproteobacteria bacterium]